VQKVLSGALLRDLRIETVEDVELAINLKTAKALGLTIPPNVLARRRRWSNKKVREAKEVRRCFKH
jgi:ABC-type uncharacterized transport system substrate-binding protein